MIFEKSVRGLLHNKLVVVLLTVATMAAGFWGYRKLPVDAFPDVAPVMVQVFTVTEGLGPEEVEKFVTFPVEAAMSGLPDVKEIRSVSNFGLSVVSVYFEDGTDIYFARQVVGERLSEARESIPQGFGEPEMGPISTGQGLILYYNLIDTTNSYSLEELRTMQDWIVKFNLQTVPGVTEVLGIGGYVRQFQVNVNPEALLRYNLTMQEVIGRIEANNENVGGQFIERNGEMFVVRSEGLAQKLEDLMQIVVTHESGTPVFLSDISKINVGGEIRQGLETMNGEHEVVSGMVIKLYGTNASTVIDAVEQKLISIQEALPEGVLIKPYYEQKTLVQNSVHTVISALLQGMVLVALVILLFVGGFRPSLVVALSIPFSILFATGAMYLLGISANLMSLGGLAIAIGMLVDGAIVVAENTDRLLKHSAKEDHKRELIVRAVTEIARPLIFSILIVILVFLPLFTLHGVEGKTFRPLAYTVTLAMLGSLIYALLAAPVFAFLFMKKPRKEHDESENNNKKEQVQADSWLVRPILWIYKPVLSTFLRFRVLAVLLSALLLALGIYVFPKLGSEFTPRLNEGSIIANLAMAPSVSLEETKRNTMIAERRVLTVPEVVSTHSRIGRGEVGAHADPINSVHMMIVLKPKQEWREGMSQGDIENQIRESLEGMPGVLANMTQPIQLTIDELVGGSKAALAIKLFGPELDVLKSQADRIASVVTEIKGAADVQPGQVVGSPQIVVRPNRASIARHGMNIADVQQLIRSAIGGVEAGQIFDGVQRYDIFVRYQSEARDSIEDLQHLIVKSPDGAQIPLDEIADILEIVGPRQIVRENNQRYIEIQANVIGRDIGGFVKEAQRAIEKQIELPTGYVLTWGGQFELQQEANKRLMIVVPVTLILIMIMLYLSFASMRYALLILMNIPLALVGGIGALWISGENLSVPASVGFIALFGVALGNAMVLVSSLNQLVAAASNVKNAAWLGACLRLRPVLMTALTTALGLIPLLLSHGTGSEVQRPLAIVVVGGLVTSTIVTLIVLPAVYTWLTPKTLKS